jgi:quercetin dioxygenase-like cupin family protein
MNNPPRRTDDVEVKYWEYPIGPTNHGLKTSATLEVTLILKGKTIAEIDGKTFELSEGNYVVITPNTPNNTVSNIIEAVQGLTIKTPSDVEAKRVVANK